MPNQTPFPCPPQFQRLRGLPARHAAARKSHGAAGGLRKTARFAALRRSAARSSEVHHAGAQLRPAPFPKRQQFSGPRRCSSTASLNAQEAALLICVVIQIPRCASVSGAASGPPGRSADGGAGGFGINPPACISAMLFWNAVWSCAMSSSECAVDKKQGRPSQICTP